MHHRAPRPPPRELQQLLAVVPVPLRKRRTPRCPRQAATIPRVRPAAALPVPSAPRQIPALPGPAADEGDADAGYLMLLAYTAVAVLPLAQADAEAEASSPPASAPAAKKLSSPSSLPPAANDEEKPYAPPLIPPLAVDENPSPCMSTDRGHAATNASAEDCKEAACPQEINAGSSSEGDQRGGGVVAFALPDAGASPMQLGDDDEELEPGEIPPEKPAAGRDADSAHESLLLGKEEETAAGEEEAKTTTAGEPAATGSSARRAPAVVVSTGAVVGRDDDRKPATEMSAAERKRMREVFVGGLSKDATEVDIRAAFSAAGEITHVRMLLDSTNCRNRNNIGYCFVAYRDPAMATKAVTELANVKICGKPCRVAAPEGNGKSNKIAQRDSIMGDYYNYIYEQRQAVHSSYIKSWDHHARHENNPYAIPASSYVVPPVVAIPTGYYYPMYHNGNRMYLPPPDLNHGLLPGPWGLQMGRSGSRGPAGQPHRSRN